MGGRHGHGSGWRAPRRTRWALVAVLAPFALATVLGLVLLRPTGSYQGPDKGNVEYVTAEVAAVLSEPCQNGVGAGTGRCVTLVVPVTGPDGAPDAAQVQVGSADPGVFHAGEEVRLGKVDGTYFYDDLVRDVPLGLLAGVFAVVVVAVARWRGLAALAGLVVTYLVLAEYLLPALLSGRSPVWTGLTASAAILFVVLYLAHGVSARTSAALIGTLLSLAATGALGAWAVGSSRLTGLSSDTAPYLQAVASHLSLSGLMLCGLVVGTIGVLNDSTVTQASAVWELVEANPRIGPGRLYASAMRIGRDHIASTIYTLLLAYAGSALPVLLLFGVSGRSGHDVLTGDEIAGELVRGMVGGVGIALSVPVTTAVAVAVVRSGWLSAAVRGYLLGRARTGRPD